MRLRVLRRAPPRSVPEPTSGFNLDRGLLHRDSFPHSRSPQGRRPGTHEVIGTLQPTLLVLLFRYVLILIFGYSFSWVYAAIGLATKDPETAQVAGILPFFILMFASNAIVPVQTMPTWLQTFARNQPLSVTVDAVRALLEGGPTAHWIWQTLAWSAAIFAVFFTIALHLYRTATS
jgi:ABC-type multidrug transport system permease subunit